MNTTLNNEGEMATTNLSANLTALEQQVLTDIVAEANRVKAQGEEVISWASAWVFGKAQENRKYASFAAGIASLVRKGVIETTWTKLVKAINPAYAAEVEAPSAEQELGKNL